MDLTGKNVLVTGANGGIGYSLVTALLDKGAAKVYAAARTIAAVEKLSHLHPGRLSHSGWTSPASQAWRRQWSIAEIWIF